MDGMTLVNGAAGVGFVVSAYRMVMGSADRNLQQRAAAAQRDERAARLERLRSDAGERNHSVCERLRSSGECVGLPDRVDRSDVVEGVVVPHLPANPQPVTDAQVLDVLLDGLVEELLTDDRERGVS